MLVCRRRAETSTEVGPSARDLVLNLLHFPHGLANFFQQACKPLLIYIKRLAAFDAREFNGAERIALLLFVMADDA